MTTLPLNLPKKMLETLQAKSKEIRPHLSDDEALQSFVQEVFIRFFMDLQPHDLTYAAVAGDDNSNLYPFKLQLSQVEIANFSSLLLYLNISGYENMLNQLRKQLFQHFSTLDPLISADPPISFGLL